MPLEQQSAANARRQLDLNVTSVAVLTAQLLRAFLAAPLHSEPAAGGSAAAGAGAAEAGAEAGGTVAPLTAQAAEDAGVEQHEPRQAERRQAGLEQTAGAAETGHRAPQRQRRRVTMVNISSVSANQPYEHFSMYGTGKAARHMLVRCVAHEAELREAAWARGQQGEGEQGERGQGRGQEREEGRGGEGSAGGGCTPPFAVVRAMSFAPGAINTEMQVGGVGPVGVVDLRAEGGVVEHLRHVQSRGTGAMVDEGGLQGLRGALGCAPWDRRGAH